jgi:hypothetical protein
MLSLSKHDSSTSVSDTSKFRGIVDAALVDPQAWKFFRSHPYFTEILEHVSKSQGWDYLRILESQSFKVREALAALGGFNKIGGPALHRFGQYGRVSPTMLRYLKVGMDLSHLFGDLRSMTVSEIGIGYGGQATVLAKRFGVRSFQFFDLPPVLKLAEKFLGEFVPDVSVTSFDGSGVIPMTKSDLVVSNYAFSELRRDVQEAYLNKVLCGSPRGYVTWNPLSPDGFSPEELLQLIPNSRLLPEEPLSFPGNVIVVWGVSH